MKDPMNILLLEDSIDDVGLIERELKKQGMVFNSRCVDTEHEYVNALNTFKPDVILSDHGLPQFNSIDALKIAQQFDCNAPFILVTGSVSEEFAVSCLKQGADDYVLKSNLVRLPSAILSSIRQREADVQRKSAELALRSQNEQLVKINKELDSFVYSVSHNLRAPLMSVLGLVNILQLENNQSSNEPYFDMMQSSIHKLDETLKEILEYSRNARSEINISEVSLAQIIDECFERLMYIQGSDAIVKNIRIEGDETFFSDGYRVGLIMSNLISNAIKYRDEQKSVSQIDILISVSPDQIQIIFHDNGVGIQEDYLPKIFNMFFRATEKSEGAGLGLYIVKETVDKLDGSIHVSSVFGEGTTFFIQLPNIKPGK
jgi:signal transduction histidine kinase